MLVAAVVALIWANSLRGRTTAHLEIGPLDLEHWAADGALTLFFYLAGLELKRELLVGSLRKPADALVPVVAAARRRACRRSSTSSVNARDGALGGWAIPAATDIAFALAVLAVVGKRPADPAARIPADPGRGRRHDRHPHHRGLLHRDDPPDWLAGARSPRRFARLLQGCASEWLMYVPLAVATWWCMYESGVHATIAGVAMGLLTRVLPDAGEDRCAGRAPRAQADRRGPPASRCRSSP